MTTMAAANASYDLLAAALLSADLLDPESSSTADVAAQPSTSSSLPDQTTVRQPNHGAVIILPSRPKQQPGVQKQEDGRTPSSDYKVVEEVKPEHVQVRGLPAAVAGLRGATSVRPLNVAVQRRVLVKRDVEGRVIFYRNLESPAPVGPSRTTGIGSAAMIASAPLSPAEYSPPLPADEKRAVEAPAALFTPSTSSAMGDAESPEQILFQNDDVLHNSGHTFYDHQSLGEVLKPNTATARSIHNMLKTTTVTPPTLMIPAKQRRVTIARAVPGYGAPVQLLQQGPPQIPSKLMAAHQQGLLKVQYPAVRIPVVMDGAGKLRVPQRIHPAQMATSQSSPALASVSGQRVSPQVVPPPLDQAANQQKLPGEEDEEVAGYAETYDDYHPAKLRWGQPHPDPVVETASLAAVPPPDIRYRMSIDEKLLDAGYVSSLQLEAVIYACQAHERHLPSGYRLGYLIGDGAGVGKGRTVAAIIFENYLKQRKRAIWLSVSSDLKYDAERDLRDIGAYNIKVHALNKFKYAKISGRENGSVKKGVIFATYASLIGECRTAKSSYKSRLRQLVQWFGVDYDGVIILDECHRAKNLFPGQGGRPTKTGQAVLSLQNALPNARIVYASATGATEPRHMAYMTRLGLWGDGRAFPDFQSFNNAVERRGVGALEIVSLSLKQHGLYLARQLSFRGVTFRVEQVDLDKEFVDMYDESVRLWLECRRQFQRALRTIAADDNATGANRVWSQFWAAHQRFFKYLCIAAKVKSCVRIAREAVASGKCVVIGMQSTGESRTLEQVNDLNGELSDFVSTAKAVLQSLVEKHFPVDSTSFHLDIFRDFDKMFDAFDAKRKRRRSGRDDLDILETFGASKRSDANSTVSGSSDDEGIDESDNSSADDESLENQTDSEVEDEEDGVQASDSWMRKLMAEAVSSSSSDDDDDEAEDDSKANASKHAAPDSDDEFNPFEWDFTAGDPWIHRQKVVNDSSDDEKERVEKARRKVERRRERRKARVMQKAQRKLQIETEAKKRTAGEFMLSSRAMMTDAADPNEPQLVKAELLAAIERLGPSLPPNTLDELVDAFGGPGNVAEMTGRKGRIVKRGDGEVTYELRHQAGDVPVELLNMDEKEAFMSGRKLVAVISEAASSGISLQSDRRAPNQRRRVHITLELPWSADKAIQQFGRTHRSNQVSAPEYVFLISGLAGEQRFASIVAKRLESLGALTHGDRRATESRDLSQFNLDTKYGRAALDVLLRTMTRQCAPLVPAPSDYKSGDFFVDMRIYMEGIGLLSLVDANSLVVERDSATIPKFLNRILGLPVHAQNALFAYFADILSELVAQARHDGTYDGGIMDLGTGGDNVKLTETRLFLGRGEVDGVYRVEMHKISVERGISWQEATDIYKTHSTGEDGFYTQATLHAGKRTVCLINGIGKRRLETGDRLFAVIRPSTGRSPKLETWEELSRRFKKIDIDEAQKLWEDQYENAAKMCQHMFVHGKCRLEGTGNYCEVGRRQRTYFILSGSVLSVWPVVEQVLSNASQPSTSGRQSKSSRMQIMRVRTDTNQRIIGLLVLPVHVRSLLAELAVHCVPSKDNNDSTGGGLLESSSNSRKG